MRLGLMRTVLGTLHRLGSARARSTGARSRARAVLAYLSQPLWLLPGGHLIGVRTVPPAPLAAGVGGGPNAGAGDGFGDAVGAGGGEVMDGTWLCLAEKDQLTHGVGETLDVHAALAAPAAAERVRVRFGGHGGASPSGDEAAVERQAPLRSGRLDGVGEGGRERGESLDAFVDVPPGGVRACQVLAASSPAGNQVRWHIKNGTVGDHEVPGSAEWLAPLQRQRASSRHGPVTRTGHEGRAQCTRA